MALCFTLSMPGVASWNGEWSGNGRRFAKIVPENRIGGQKRKYQLLEKEYWTHGWPDGWRAGVSVKEVTGPEARKISRESQGFSGYDWMVDDIMRTGSIKPAYDGCHTS